MKLRIVGVLIGSQLALSVSAAGHIGGAFWPVAKVMRAVDDRRIHVAGTVVLVDTDTTLCSGEGRARLRQGVRTWTHFRCTFSTFTARGPGRDVEFRVHALDARRITISNARWIGG